MDETTNLITILDWIRWAMSRFQEANLYYGHGTDNPYDEALALILTTLHLSYDINPSLLAAKLTNQESKKLLNIINLRIHKKIPVPYLTHEAYFGNRVFYVDERVLIPRSSLAEFINNKFEPWLIKTPNKILDLCTGSGCIAISCAKSFSASEIHASDISADALDVAKINLQRHHLTKQIKLYESDLFANIPENKFDIIISNPPYVDANDMAELPSEYQHEPKLALAAGDDGLDIIRRILVNAGDYLTKDGILIIEAGNSEIALNKKMPEVPFTWLELESGDNGIFILTAEQLLNIKNKISTSAK